MNAQLSTWVLVGVIGLGALLWFWFRQRPQQERRGLERQVFLWKKFGDVRRLAGSEEYGIVAIEGHGGFAVTADSTTILRFGRVARRVYTEGEAETLRKRTLVMVTREGDPAPVVASHGRSNQYQGIQKVNVAFKDSLRKDAIEFAVADHKKKGAEKNVGTMRLVLALIVVALITGAVWLSIPLVGILRG